MKKKVVVLFIGFIILGFGIFQISQYNQKYNNKEKITATIYKIEKKKEEYREYNSDTHQEHIKHYYIYNVQYEYKHQGEMKTDVTRYCNLFWKEKNKRNVYYDHTTDSTNIYVIPYFWYYTSIVGIILCIIGILAYQKKYNVRNLVQGGRAPIIVHIILPIFSFAVYWNLYINKQRTSFGQTGLMFFFMVIHLLILQGCIRDILTNHAVKEEV